MLHSSLLCLFTGTLTLNLLALFFLNGLDLLNDGRSFTFGQLLAFVVLKGFIDLFKVFALEIHNVFRRSFCC